jgi:DNA processing protein
MDLNIQGKILKKDKRAVAIVGTRTPTKYGREVAYKFSFELAKKGITIVSGLARGIDTVAHNAALDAGGRTIAVLGSGLDVIYPPENLGLAQRIIKSGALVSQFAYGTKPLGKNFLIRNELVARLSRAILVVEGSRRSGTISTASHAANLGVEVFAVPGPVNSPMSEAPLYLIEQGAQIARVPGDILEYINSLS